MITNNSKKERENLNKALAALDLWFDSHDKVQTGFGEQYTVNGYKLLKTHITDRWIILTVYVLDRSIQEKDYIRCGDEAAFRYTISTNSIEEN